MIDFKFGRFYFSKRILNPPPIIVSTNVPLYRDCRVHLNSRNGTYIVTSYNENIAIITCQVWKNEYSRGDRDHSTKSIPRSDVKCLYGQGNRI